MPQARTLSEQEFNTVRDRVLRAAPPNLSEEDFTRFIGPAMAQAVGAAENTPPEAHMGPPTPGSPVTLGDLMDNPSEAFTRIGGLLKRDLSNPKFWLAAAVSYFGPKIIPRVAPIIVQGMKSGARVVPTVARIGVEMFSPRMGRAVDAAQRLRAALPAPVTAVEAPVTATAPALLTPSARAPRSAPPPARPAQTAPAPAVVQALKLKLTADEFQAAKGLIAEGYDPKAVLAEIERHRLPEAWRNLPSDAKVKASVTDRNVKGQWPEEP